MKKKQFLALSLILTTMCSQLTGCSYEQLGNLFQGKKTVEETTVEETTGDTNFNQDSYVEQTSEDNSAEVIVEGTPSEMLLEGENMLLEHIIELTDNQINRIIIEMDNNVISGVKCTYYAKDRFSQELIASIKTYISEFLHCSEAVIEMYPEFSELDEVEKFIIGNIDPKNRTIECKACTIDFAEDDCVQVITPGDGDWITIPFSEDAVIATLGESGTPEELLTLEELADLVKGQDVVAAECLRSSEDIYYLGLDTAFYNSCFLSMFYEYHGGNNSQYVKRFQKDIENKSPYDENAGFMNGYAEAVFKGLQVNESMEEGFVEKKTIKLINCTGEEDLSSQKMVDFDSVIQNENGDYVASFTYGQRIFTASALEPVNQWMNSCFYKFDEQYKKCRQNAIASAMANENHVPSREYHVNYYGPWVYLDGGRMASVEFSYNIQDDDDQGIVSNTFNYDMTAGREITLLEAMGMDETKALQLISDKIDEEIANIGYDSSVKECFQGMQMEDYIWFIDRSGIVINLLGTEFDTRVYIMPWAETEDGKDILMM